MKNISEAVTTPNDAAQLIDTVLTRPRWDHKYNCDSILAVYNALYTLSTFAYTRREENTWLAAYNTACDDLPTDRQT